MFREIELIRSPAVNARHENAMISRRRSNCRFGRIPTPASRSMSSMTTSVVTICTTSAQ